MTLKPIAIESFVAKPFHLWDIQTLLLTSGDFASHEFNAMTVGWGSLGYLWRRPFIQVMVRPVRYTYEFMEKFNTFSVCAFPKQYYSALQLLGTRSGRDGDKLAASGLTPLPATRIAAPVYAQASLVIECRKIYWDDFHPQNFVDPAIDRHYPAKDYHRIYFGEIVALFGEDTFKD